MTPNLKSKTLFLVVLFEVIDVLDRFWLVVHGEHILSDTVVHTLEHRVMLSVLAIHREVLLNTRNAVKTHVLSYLNGIILSRNHKHLIINKFLFLFIFAIFSKKQ